MSPFAVIDGGKGSTGAHGSMVLKVLVLRGSRGSPGSRSAVRCTVL